MTGLRWLPVSFSGGGFTSESYDEVKQQVNSNVRLRSCLHKLRDEVAEDRGGAHWLRFHWRMRWHWWSRPGYKVRHTSIRKSVVLAAAALIPASTFSACFAKRAIVSSRCRRRSASLRAISSRRARAAARFASILFRALQW